MVDIASKCNVTAEVINDPKRYLNNEPYTWAVGHEDTSAVFSSILGKDEKAARITLKLKDGDTLLIGQLMGGRLPEGATTLPDNFSIKWLKITVEIM